jgi:hypothetical protein
MSRTQQSMLGPWLLPFFQHHLEIYRDEFPMPGAKDAIIASDGNNKRQSVD